jgi:4-aminobutyrate aminotransferase-like enzyme/Ser/Thr protein kinase RdoA (MazF antagonist)
VSGLFEGYEILAPPFEADDGRKLAIELFGLAGEPLELGSHQDRNFRITAGDGRRAVLKIANPHFGRESLEMQNAAMLHVAAAGLPFGTPRPMPALDGGLIVAVDRGGETYHVRLVSYLEGSPLTEAGHLAASIRSTLGGMAAGIADALAGFDHAAADRVLQWDVRRARAVVDGLIRHVRDAERRELVERAMAVHDAALDRQSGSPRQQVIHGDVTDYNVIGERDRSGRLAPNGLIDFGDMIRSYLVGEAAVLATSVITHDPSDALAAVVDVVRGFHQRLPLTEQELSALFPLVLGRAALSAVSTEQQAILEPDNRYAVGLIDSDWGSLAAAAGLPPALVEAALRAACGIDPHPRSGELRRFLERGGFIAPIDPAGRTLRTVDLSAGAAAYAYGEWESRDGVAGAVAVGPGELAVGRWGEARLHRAPHPGAAEPDALHLGVDVFAAAGEPVTSPFPAEVAELREDAVVLRHRDPDFLLELAHVEPAALGDRVEAGATVAVVAGGSIPHLHVQLAIEPDGMPGWGMPSQRSAWLALHPDPSPLIGVEAAAPHRDAAALLAARRRVVAGAQQVYYEHPPEMVRGWRQRMYDADGRAYLDMVNNVAVVGHSHPAIAAAAERQLQLLNTNSRFLYESMVELAERIAELLPAPLDSVFFVNSGSEANDLALRLARTFTGREDVIATGGAYHGWTTATYEVSTSPVDNPAAALAPPPGLRVVPQANTYRGPHGGDDPRAGERYAEHVRACAGGAAAFICEPVLGNAGGLLVPPGYLAAAYAHVREAGGLCISDEVQVGYGRLGEWFWAFQQQDAVPDIVTMAKSTGNGQPLGAVVTSREIADAFDRNAGFFSSVGGSPLSCRIGLAVLDAIRDERLAENAAAVGAHLRRSLERLAERHRLIGAVHGTGLYLGVELVRDREDKTPAKHEAYAICERMLELGVIVQPTGDHENVLKVKPPLCIDTADADLFVAALDRVLTEGW